MVVKADLSKLDEVLQFIGESVKQLVKSDEVDVMTSKLQFIVDELFSNIAMYSGEEVEAEIDIYLNSDKKLVLVIADNGIEYNPLLKQDPDVNIGFEKREVGGLGIFLVKNSVESMEYVYEDGRNKLIMII